jgi:hypothetical protein
MYYYKCQKCNVVWYYDNYPNEDPEDVPPVITECNTCGRTATMISHEEINEFTGPFGARQLQEVIDRAKIRDSEALM